MSIGSGNNYLYRNLVNNGAVTWTGAGGTYLHLNNTTIENNYNFTANVAASSVAELQGEGGASVFNNSGSFTKLGPGDARFGGGSTGVVFNNSGTVDLQGGLLQLSPGGTHTGNFTGVTGATLEFDGNHTLAAGSAISGAMQVRNRGTLTVAAGSNLGTTGGFTNAGGATLKGTGTVQANLTNSGKLAPGNSPGIITVAGDFTQTATGIVEIEFGGPTPGPTGHDKLIVTGAASLAGRLEVPLINNYLPPVGTEIEFLTASNGVNGQFTALVAPNLAAVNQSNSANLAFLAVYGTNNIRLRVVEKNSDVLFSSVSQQTEWSTAGTWSTPQPPDLQNVVGISNLYNGAEQTVNVSSADARVHSLTLMDGSDPITVNVGNSKSLSSQTDIAIGNHGSLELQLGTTVNAANITVQSGGLLAGNGTIAANNVLVSGGTLRPGFSVGHLDVNGDYAQESGGTLLVEIDSASQYDTVSVTGNATLGGTLKINSASLTTIVPGSLYPILTADSITGAFTSVESTGNNNVYFLAKTIGATTYAEGYERGDMNGDGRIEPDVDFDLFAFGLMNRSASKYFAKCNCEILPQQGGDFSGNGRLDFDDIAGFQARLGGMGMSSATFYAILDGYLRPVPEPSSAVLVIFGGIITNVMQVKRVRRDRITAGIRESRLAARS